jgi:hypothetical protein
MSQRALSLIKDRVSLEDYLISHCGVIEFASSGIGSMTAMCPFHEDAVPTLQLYNDPTNPNWQRWLCQGTCGASGSVIDACMRKESLSSSMQAAEYLDNLYGLRLPRFQSPEELYEARLRLPSLSKSLLAPRVS